MTSRGAGDRFRELRRYVSDHRTVSVAGAPHDVEGFRSACEGILGRSLRRGESQTISLYAYAHHHVEPEHVLLWGGRVMGGSALPLLELGLDPESELDWVVLEAGDDLRRLPSDLVEPFGRSVAAWYKRRYAGWKALRALVATGSRRRGHDAHPAIERRTRYAWWVPWLAGTVVAAILLGMTYARGGTDAWWLRPLLWGALTLFAVSPVAFASAIGWESPGALLKGLDLTMPRLVPAIAVGCSLLLGGGAEVALWTTRLPWSGCVAMVVIVAVYVFVDIHRRLVDQALDTTGVRRRVLMRGSFTVLQGVLWAFLLAAISAELVHHAIITVPDLAMMQTSRGLFGGEVITGLLLRFAPVALLLGVMLQLIWEDKSPMESS